MLTTVHVLTYIGESRMYSYQREKIILSYNISRVVLKRIEVLYRTNFADCAKSQKTKERHSQAEINGIDSTHNEGVRLGRSICSANKTNKTTWVECGIHTLSNSSFHSYTNFTTLFIDPPGPTSGFKRNLVCISGCPLMPEKLENWKKACFSGLCWKNWKKYTFTPISAGKTGKIFV